MSRANRRFAISWGQVTTMEEVTSASVVLHFSDGKFLAVEQPFDEMLERWRLAMEPTPKALVPLEAHHYLMPHTRIGTADPPFPVPIDTSLGEP